MRPPATVPSPSAEHGPLTAPLEILPEAPSDADLLLCSRWGITYPQLIEERATTLVFKIPMPPTLTNSGKGRSRHWRVIEREKEQYWTLLTIAKQFKTIPPPPAVPWEKARIQSLMVLGGAMDDDNAMARHKWPIDWLVRNGYIKSDRKSCLVWADFPTQRVSRKEDKTITITLTRRV